MQSLPVKKIVFSVICVMCAIALSAQESSAPPPMRTGNGSELELKNLSWPRDNQLPTTNPNTQFMQKRLEDYLEPVSLQIKDYSMFFPENPSEFMMKVILLHAAKESIAGLQDETIARVNKMFSTESLLGGDLTSDYTPTFPWMMGASRGLSGGAGVAYVGIIDPVEIYRNWQRRKRAMRTQIVLMTLFGDDARLLTKYETDSIRREEEHLRNLSVTTTVDNPTPISVILQNDTVVAPSNPKFTAPLFGKERPALPADSLSGQ